MKTQVISYEDFIKTWMSSSAVKEVCEKTGLTYRQVHNRAATLRKRGVDLPHFARGARLPAVDAVGLNALITQMTIKKT